MYDYQNRKLCVAPINFILLLNENNNNNEEWNDIEGDGDKDEGRNEEDNRLTMVHEEGKWYWKTEKV